MDESGSDTPGTVAVWRHSWEQGALTQSRDRVACEQAIALVYNGISHAVMMATPADLEDFALGFSLSEGILSDAGQLLDVEICDRDNGIELALTITSEPFAALKSRRRNLTGRTGCGLCGAESLDQAIRVPAPVTTSLTIEHSAVQRALSHFAEHQVYNRESGAVHAAAWCDPQGNIRLLREDVGRHNALDKLIGAMASSQCERAGFALVSSRASYEMVTKTASANIPLLAAVSAPTSLAIDMAQRCNLTLIGFVREGRQVVYSGHQRLSGVE